MDAERAPSSLPQADLREDGSGCLRKLTAASHVELMTDLNSWVGIHMGAMRREHSFSALLRVAVGSAYEYKVRSEANALQYPLIAYPEVFTLCMCSSGSTGLGAQLQARQSEATTLSETTDSTWAGLLLTPLFLLALQLRQLDLESVSLDAAVS